MQEFCRFAVFAETTLRQRPDYDPNNEDGETSAFHAAQTVSTLRLTAKFFGQEAVERSGSLFLHISAIKFLGIDFNIKSITYPPL